ncbi:cc951494-32e8-48af-a945-483ffee49ab9 [Sclerotinia trifoliorum]|uniref:Cc951494-32e8-48af-a945-483ffee49ab9 n=1 Tax=Sclerotinia trifoliorum TaxID=28548 RepID=A0A8H2W651_9HELO|nr:cc951494-32e8-48af-a945-483ffee49ab9 [Sclerotinia trifoliorum]
MATFAQKSFSATSYATFRPSYPQKLYTQILNYHRGPRTTLLDLGCGHGVISRALGSAGNFEKIWGTDPSSVMIEEAKTLSNKINANNLYNKEANIEWRQASAEDLSFVEDGSLDMVVAGQAAHWFDFSRVWGEVYRKLRRGGTVAFWGYKDNLLVDFPDATNVLDKFCYGMDERFMGRFWEQPGRERLRGLYRDQVMQLPGICLGMWSA